MSEIKYACPVCAAPLLKADRVWSCENRHTFDEHKKGYLNLLLAQNKRSKEPGDDVEMVLSRRRFLENKHYLPMAAQLSSLISDHCTEQSTLLDAGCGEGFYTHLIQSQNPSFDCYGLDISKPAVTAACSYKNIFWSVASSSKAPFLNDSFDAIVSVFSRIDNDSFFRILKPSGSVFMVAPDHDHLMALRAHIYDEIRPYETEKHKSYFDERFQLNHEERFTVDINLEDQQGIQDLLGMTPHAHRLPEAARKRIALLTTLDDQACFKLYRFDVVKDHGE